MSFLSWLVVGLLAGWIGSMVVNRRGEGLIMDIVLGVVGAFVGGYLFHLFGHSGVSGINLYSIFVAAVGAIVVLVIYHALVRPRML
ncbi:MAG TPA: GlsB/YeaQ/YmgE family stress response membrane protein [Caulobacteraceae bacterium]|nr:GlsB/YeaQ/YmgE family stress response membrane protein [Caulobacteraceae bacterium]